MSAALAEIKPRRTSWTAAELMTCTFPPPRWAVPGIVAEGVTMLAGPPKVGKSWLSLGLALAVATGGQALDRLAVEAGDVLYLALEDTPRRLKSRIRKVLGDRPAPEQLTLSIACAPIPVGGDEQITSWLDRHPDARLVVIDVFAKVRGTAAMNSSIYDADYLAMSRLKLIADRHEIAIIVVHHTRKAAAEDFLNEVSGTNGLAGAADAICVLRRPRGQADGTLHVTGRDIDETEYPLGWDADRGAWTLLDGPAADYLLSASRLAIVTHLREQGPRKPKALADAMNAPYEATKKTCKRMHDDGQLDVDSAGTYSVPPPLPVPGVPAVPLWRDEGHPRDTLDPVAHTGEGHGGREGQG